MTESSRAFVTLGADVGGRDAFAATNEHVLALRCALAEFCEGPYGSAIQEVALALRIDGSVQAWMKSGVAGLAIRSKQAYATADIYVPREAWENQTAVSLRNFLAAEIVAAVSEIVLRLARKGIHIEGDELKADVRNAVMQFTSASKPDAKV